MELDFTGLTQNTPGTTELQAAAIPASLQLQKKADERQREI